MKAINWSNRTVRNQTTEQQFESYSIIRRFKSLTRVNSGQSTCSYRWALLFLLPFSFSFHHPQQQNPTNPGFCQLVQIVQFLCFIVVITFLTLAAAVSDMVGFSLLIHYKRFFWVVFKHCCGKTKSAAFSSFDLWGVARVHLTWQPVKPWSNHSFTKKINQSMCLFASFARTLTSCFVEMKKLIRGL